MVVLFHLFRFLFLNLVVLILIFDDCLLTVLNAHVSGNFKRMETIYSLTFIIHKHHPVFENCALLSEFVWLFIRWIAVILKLTPYHILLEKKNK